MDAAAAAAMSDPERNPHFRRRWNEALRPDPAGVPQPDTAPNDWPDVAGRELLELWRRMRAVVRGGAL